MLRTLSAMVLVLGLLAGPVAEAGERTIRLSVPGMYCAACPYIVEQAILEVEGVSAAEADIDDRSATVTFDDEIVDIAEITASTARYGYPSSLVTPGG